MIDRQLYLPAGMPAARATRCNDDVVTTSMGRVRVDELIAGLPRRAWSRISAVRVLTGHAGLSGGPAVGTGCSPDAV
ncbi:hypothetical protein ACQPZX_14985 [Actinoplanes sp. CA-142083]|uniref:hypothetical protein n=1 Tax=Actinoplanes sp. CA-142083 TaxID=3239903 RepID=UPI003D8B1E9E